MRGHSRYNHKTGSLLPLSSMRVGLPRDQAAAKRGTVRNCEGGWGGGVVQ